MTLKSSLKLSADCLSTFDPHYRVGLLSKKVWKVALQLGTWLFVAEGSSMDSIYFSMELKVFNYLDFSIDQVVRLSLA